MRPETDVPSISALTESQHAVARASLNRMPVLEPNKRSGVAYALTKDGVELPVIDITHPVFALNITDAEQSALVQKFLREPISFHFLPRRIRSALLQFFLRNSMLAEGIRRSQNSFMPGMHTYLLKLGPDMLPTAYANPIDRRIAVSLPAVAVRLRLQDVASLMVEAVVSPLSQAPNRPLHLINIAGGPAIDSLNMLILLCKNHSGILAQREIFLDILDLDDTGPAFGQGALAALSAPGAPLHGLRVNFRAIHCDWSNTDVLQQAVNQARSREGFIFCSSEGGLFEYGSDEDVLANLKVLHAADQVIGVAGSATRADEPIQRLHTISSAKTKPRGLSAFRALVQKAGWDVSRVIERPFSDHFLLR